MLSIIEKIYNGYINETENVSAGKENELSEKEFGLYLKLIESLSAEQAQMLNEFIDLLCLRTNVSIEQKYIRGFKTGLLLGIECSDMKFE